MGRGQQGPESAAELTPAQRRSAPRTIGGAGTAGTAFNLASGAFHKVNTFLIERFGLDRHERMALAGTAVAAPLAALAGPVLGFGVAMALVAPHMARKYKEQKQGRSAESEQAAALETRQQLAPMMPNAEAEILDAEARVSVLEKELAETIQGAAELEQARQTQIEEEVRKRLAVTEEKVELEDRLERVEWENEQLRRQLAEARAGAAPEASEPQLPADEASQDSAQRPEPARSNSSAGGFDREAYLAQRRAERDKAAHVLMPLAPHWSEHILRGDAKYEFRKGSVKALEPGSRVAIYTKSPVKAITGYFDVDDVYAGTPDRVWEQVKDDPEFGYTEDEFFRHCGRSKRVTVSKIGSVRRLDQPANTDALGFKPTDLQGVKYLHYQTDDRHDKVLTLTEQQDAVIAEANGGKLPVGTGSETPPELLEAALESKAKEERKSGRQNSALA